MKRSCWVRIAVLLSCALIAATAFFVLRQEWGDRLLWLLEQTHATWKKPKVFGTFHLWHLAMCVLASILVAIWCLKKQVKDTDGTVFAAGTALYILELYKQLYSYFVLQEQQFDFGFFPFQFCSLPLYLYLLVPLMREGRCKEALYRFLALYGVMGGCLVMGYPAWFEEIPLCIHTMLWHTVMIVTGIYILFARRYGREYRKEMIPATVVFLMMVSIATGLNFLLESPAQGSPNPINLYYMNPYRGGTRYFVIRDVWETMGWGGAMVCYVLLFIFVGATLVWGCARLIYWLAERFGSNENGNFTKK